MYKKRRVLKNTDGTLYYWNYPKEFWVDKQGFVDTLEMLISQKPETVAELGGSNNNLFKLLLFVARLPGDMVNLLDPTTLKFINDYFGLSFVQYAELMGYEVPESAKTKPVVEDKDSDGLQNFVSDPNYI